MNSHMKRVRIFWISLLLFPVIFSAATAAEMHPKYGPKVTLLIHDHQYFQKAAAGDFWRLMPFYVPQCNDYACSVASIAMVFNAASKGRTGVPDTERNVTQDMLLERIREVPLRELVSKDGLQGRHGLTLDELKSAVEQAARALGVRAQVTADSFQNRSMDEFRKMLQANEDDPSDFLLVHFVQDDLTGARGGPYAHISPVGAYDGATRRVLILDVDREWYSPYWVSDEDLLAACKHGTKPLGVGGLVRMRFNSTSESPR